MTFETLCHKIDNAIQHITLYRREQDLVNTKFLEKHGQ